MIRSPRIASVLVDLTLMLSASCGAPSEPKSRADASVGSKVEAGAGDGAAGDGGLRGGSIHATAASKGYVTPSAGDAGSAAAARATCTFTRGAMPAATLEPTVPFGQAMPIDHIVVLVQENHSFDQYLGHLAAYEATLGIINTIDSASDSATNPTYPVDEPLPDGGIPTSDAGALHHYAHAPQLCYFDPGHSWFCNHVASDHGHNDGFFFTSDGYGGNQSFSGIDPSQLSGDRALWWYDERDLPSAYQIYSSFAISDAYFADVLAPTYPNRQYLYAGTSFGEVANYSPSIGAYTEGKPSLIFDEMQDAGTSWTIYSEADPAIDGVMGISVAIRYGASTVSTISQFLADAAAGALPTVSFVDAIGATGDNEHPAAEIELGQHFVWRIANAVTTSPNWNHTALFVLYDDAGGSFDHVSPPTACPPDETAPRFYLVCANGDPCLGAACSACGAVMPRWADLLQPAAFDQYGFRVPFVLISPYAKPSYVSHHVYSHASILRFIETRAGLPALTNRDANADPFSDMFDWQSPPLLAPPTLIEPPIDRAAVAACTSALTPQVVPGRRWTAKGPRPDDEDTSDWLGRRRLVY